MKQFYQSPKFHASSRKLIEACDRVLAEHTERGFKMTTRQLYYQLVAEGELENSIRSYENMATVVGNARMAGLIDWDALEDRLRGVLERPRWKDGRACLESAAEGYREDMWQGQGCRAIVVIEKEMLAGCLKQVCTNYDAPLLASRGYPSSVSLRQIANSVKMQACPNLVILHLGNLDNCSVDIGRDLQVRLSQFLGDGVSVELKRLALNRTQAEALKLPTAPSKLTGAEQTIHAKQIWELDALAPEYLSGLTENGLKSLIDFSVWNENAQRVENTRNQLRTAAENFRSK